MHAEGPGDQEAWTSGHAHGLRKVDAGVVPADDFAQGEAPLGAEGLLQDGKVKMAELPPGVGGVLVLCLEDGNEAPAGVDQKGIWLTKAMTARAKLRKTEPRGGEVERVEGFMKVFVHLSLVADALGLAALSRRTLDK